MASYYLAPDPIQSTQFIPGGNTPASGGQLFFYVAGSTTKSTVYKDNAGGSSWTNPIVLDSGGNLPSGGEVWFAAGITYKVVFAPSTDTDPPLSPYWTKDNISGINDISSAVSEWISGPTPTFVSATSFTVVGDQTATFQVGRRVKFTVTAGTVYGTIQTSAFTSLTTVTIGGGEGPLDSGLSAVFYSILSATNNAVPALQYSCYQAIGNKSLNNTTTPTTKFDLVADAIVLRNKTTKQTFATTSPATVTNDTTSTGPSVNGRDQSGAFSSSTAFLHFYWIWNGTTLGSISSTTSPPTGPVLPSGYTHWAYCSAVKYNTSNVMTASHVNGSWVHYDASQIVVSGGNSTSEVATDLTPYVPANAESIDLYGYGTVTGNGGGAVSTFLIYRYVSGSNFSHGQVAFPSGANAYAVSQNSCVMPNRAQNFYYVWNNNTNVTSLSADIYIRGYKIPNGGE